MNTVDTALEMTRKLDYIQAMIWARINDEVNARNIKLTVGDCYALGSVIKEVLHPEVRSLTNEAELRLIDTLIDEQEDSQDWERAHPGYSATMVTLETLVKHKAALLKLKGGEEL